MSPTHWTTLLIVLCSCLSGCGGASDKIKVTGIVTWNGEPVESGFVSFKPLDNEQAPEAGAIRDGEFTLYARPGKNRVEIRATKETGYDAVMKQPIFAQYIPRKYNLQSSLTEEVSNSGQNSFEFKLSQ